jgi:hypothetical protein
MSVVKKSSFYFPLGTLILEIVLLLKNIKIRTEKEYNFFSSKNDRL